MRPETQKVWRRIVYGLTGVGCGYCVYHWRVFRDHPWEFVINVAVTWAVIFYARFAMTRQVAGMTTLRLAGAKTKVQPLSSAAGEQLDGDSLGG